MANNLLQMAQPASTNVHNNIDNLILQADLDKFDKTGVMYADKTPQYIGGADDVVANVALGPLLTLKSLGGIGKKIKERVQDIKNPLYHFTSVPKAGQIFQSGKIEPSVRFPSSRTRDNKGGFPVGFSLTRNPVFDSVKQNYVPKEVRIVVDKDDLVRKGRVFKPIAEPMFQKTINNYSRPPITLENYKKIHGFYPDQMNPFYEAEERILGALPLKDIRLIDFLDFSSDAISNLDKGNLLYNVFSRNIPVMMSGQAKKNILDITRGRDILGPRDIKKIIETPTY